METKYIKLEPEEAIFLKKELLSSELDFLHLIKKIRMYRISRDKEFLEKSNLKKNINTIRTKINSIILSFPKVDYIPSNFNKPVEEKVSRFGFKQTDKRIDTELKKYNKKDEIYSDEESEKIISRKKEFIKTKSKDTPQQKIEPKKNKITAPEKDEEKMKSDQDEIEEIRAQLRKLED
jgi:hypothetical protein